jgi:hypothetical protein
LVTLMRQVVGYRLLVGVVDREAEVKRVTCCGAVDVADLVGVDRSAEVGACRLRGGRRGAEPAD